MDARAPPCRLSRAAFGSANPLMGTVHGAAAKAAAERKPVSADNPFLAMEKLWAKGTEAVLDVYRDWRDALYETTFLGVYGSPAMIEIGEPFAFTRTLKDPKALRFLPEV